MRPNFKNIDIANEAFNVEHKPLVMGEPWKNAELLDIKPVYTKEDLEGLEHLDFVAGIPPFLGGPYSLMYPFRPWTVRQYAGFSTAAESNAFYRRNLASGQKGLSVAFDLPTHRGYNADQIHSLVHSCASRSGSCSPDPIVPVDHSPYRNSAAKVPIPVYRATPRIRPHQTRRASGSDSLP